MQSAHGESGGCATGRCRLAEAALLAFAGRQQQPARASAHDAPKISLQCSPPAFPALSLWATMERGIAWRICLNGSRLRLVQRRIQTAATARDRCLTNTDRNCIREREHRRIDLGLAPVQTATACHSSRVVAGQRTPDDRDVDLALGDGGNDRRQGSCPCRMPRMFAESHVAPAPRRAARNLLRGPARRCSC